MQIRFYTILGISLNCLLASRAQTKELCMDHGNNSICYPKIFQPNNDFEIIYPDQIIPPGLHIRINMESGLKEGKLTEASSSKNSEVMLRPESSILISKLPSKPLAESALTVEERESLADIFKILASKSEPEPESQSTDVYKKLEFLSEVSC